MNALPMRISASPYARRLARESGVPLAGLTGSGPRGRIVARDVETFRAAASTALAVPAQPSEGERPVPAPARSTGALAASLPMAPMMQLILAFAAAGRQITLEFLVELAMPANDRERCVLLVLRGETLRPVAMPVPADCDLHLTVCLDEANGIVEILLGFAMPAFEPQTAADFLAGYRDNLLKPLRLFV